ncbi:MAG: ParA family protein [Clostridiales bacterium]|nr:ParA family protein [Clostridiales bacterium]
MRARVITFSNQKGGVGKTTTCINLAACVAKEGGKKVLVIDLDPQGNASSGLGFFDRKTPKSIYGLICGKLDARDVISDTCIENLKLIPSSIDLAGAELELAQVVIGREKVLSEKIEPLLNEFDFVMIDCPPSLGLLTVNALTASDSVIVPIQSEYYALEGLSQMMNTIRLVKKHLNDRLMVDGVVLTLYDGRAKLSGQVAEEIEKFFGDRMFETKIPRNVRLAEAPSYGKPIIIYDPACLGAKAYSALAQEYLDRLNG